MIKQLSKTGNSLRWLLFIAMAIVIESCGGARNELPQAPPTDVDFFETASKTSLVETKYPGTIEGSVNVDIKAQVSGYLEEIYVKEGDYVNKGQALFKIKGEVFKEQVNNSQAGLKAALAAQANAKLEVEKVRPLVEGNVVSDIQLKTAEAAYDAAAAQVAQARAAVGSSRINADFATINAPVSGYIGRIPNRTGNLVTPTDTTPLTTLSDINTVFVYFSMSEADYMSFIRDRKNEEGTSNVDLVTADGSTYEHKGKLEQASGNIDRSTGSIAIKAVFPNPGKLLRSGGSARVVINKPYNDAVTVPMASVKDLQDRFFVFVLADSNKVSMRPFQVAGRIGTDYIVKTGLKPGEKVALNNIDILNEGMLVNPKITKQPNRDNK